MDAAPAPMESTPAEAAVEAPPPCGGAVCDDGDPCTRDACDGSECVFSAIDADGDGYAPGACTPGSAARGGDCDDTRKDVHPGASEICDELDNDCKGGVDQGLAKVQCYPDLDRDGFANLDGKPVAACAACPAFALAIENPSARARHDCWDDPATGGTRVFPGQPNFFDVGYGPDNERQWDYNCDRKVDRQLKALSGQCGGVLGLLCTGEQGFSGNATPDCGETGKYRVCGSSGLNCNGVEDTRKQLCK
jgi:hypothetical protein